MSDTICKAYHYLSQSNWFGVKEGMFGRPNQLMPYRPLVQLEGKGIPKWAHEMYIFAFRDTPMPKEWTSNSEYPDIWDRIMEHVHHGDPVLTMVQIDIQRKDKAYVVDWAYMESVRDELRKFSMLISTDDDRDKIKQASVKYANSRVPAADYSGGYRLPELVIANNISLDRIIELEECAIPCQRSSAL